MAAARAHRGLPERWLLPPAPRTRPAATIWDGLTFDRRRDLARTRRNDLPACDADEREVLAGLARARLATRWRLLAAAPVLAWLVLMAVWGFGRTTGSDPALWLGAGLLLSAATWLGAALAAAARLRRARGILTELAGAEPAGDTHRPEPDRPHPRRPDRPVAVPSVESDDPRP